MAASVRFGASSLLLSLASRCCRWRLLIVGSVYLSSLLLDSRCCCRSLVVVTVSLLSAAASLLVAASAGFCPSSSLSLSASRRRCWRLLVVCGISLLSLLLASRCHRWRRVVVVVVGGVPSFSTKAYYILGLPCMQPQWSCNTKRRMVLLRYQVCGSCISSSRHPKKLFSEYFLSSLYPKKNE